MKRYVMPEVRTEWVEDPDGEWVKFDDVEPELKELARLRKLFDDAGQGEHNAYCSVCDGTGYERDGFAVCRTCTR